MIYGDRAPGQSQNVVIHGDGAPGQSQNVLIYGDRAPGRSQNVVIYGDHAPGRSQNDFCYWSIGGPGSCQNRNEINCDHVSLSETNTSHLTVDIGETLNQLTSEPVHQ